MFANILFDNALTLDNLFEAKMRGLYDAEKQQVQLLPKLAASATDLRLRRRFEKHLGETQTHVRRLEQIAGGLQLDLQGACCQAMQGLLTEGELVLKLNASDEVVDIALIAAVQSVKHYEIVQYGMAIHIARRLAQEPVAQLLDATLAEERNTEEALNQLTGYYDGR